MTSLTAVAATGWSIEAVPKIVERVLGSAERCVPLPRCDSPARRWYPGCARTE